MGEKIVNFLRKNPIVLILAAFIAVASILTPNFMTFGNIRNLLTQSSIQGIIALGATFLILTGYRDLSVGALMGLSGALTVKMQLSYSVWAGIGFAIIVALIVGLINGFLVVKVGINTFIATLASMLGCRGSMFLYTGGIPVSATDTRFIEFGSGYFLQIPNLFIVFGILVLVADFVLRRTTHGRNTYAVGGNKEAASNAGINVQRTAIANFMICSLGAALGGILMAARTSASYPNMGWPDTHFIVIVMVVLGGTKLIGGIGNAFYTLGGVLVLTIIQNVFNLLKISAVYDPLITGLILIGTLYMDSVINPATMSNLKKKKRLKSGPASE